MLWSVYTIYLQKTFRPVRHKLCRKLYNPTLSQSPSQHFLYETTYATSPTMAKLTVKTRFLVISDTQGSEDFRRPQDPAGVGIHCGDLTDESKPDEFRATLRFLKRLDAPLKLVIAGNHDFTLDTPVFERKIAEAGPLE